MANGEEDTESLAGLLEPVCRRELRARQRQALHEQVAADPTSSALAALGFAPEKGFEERLEALSQTADFCPARTLVVAGYGLEVRTSLEELWRFYLPLCLLLRQHAARKRSRRILAGVCGPPGSGKSVFAELLKALLNSFNGSNNPMAAELCCLDGFHYPNSYLESHYLNGANGNRVCLRSRKGAPESYDVGAFLGSLDRLSSASRVGLPAYDRTVHDPVPGRVSVEVHHRMIVVEGNYLVLDERRWKEVDRRLDICLFLTMPFEAAKAAVIERHMRGGRSREDAERYYDSLDEENYYLCMSSAHRADLIVVRNGAQEICSFERPARQA